MRWIPIPCSVAIHVILFVVVVNLPGRSPGPGVRSRPPVDIVFYPEPLPLELVAEPLPPPVPEPQPQRPRESPPSPPVPETIVQQAEPVPAPPPPVAVTPPEPPAPDPRPAIAEVRTRVFAALEPVEPDRPAPERQLRPSVFGGTGPVSETPVAEKRRAVMGLFSTNRGPRDLVVAAGAQVASPSGFGDASRPVTGRSAAAVNNGSIERGSFGDAVAVVRPAGPRELSRPEPDVPVEIISKPRPAYTDEARRLGIEGEVLLEVTFAASGKLSIHRILESLGHGLDEAAVVAARSIAFKPARRDGRPIDFTATLRVVFQLA